MRRIEYPGLWGAALLALGLLGAARIDVGEGRLTLVESPARDDLDGVVAPAISADGKFLYVPSWKAATLAVFARDPKTGKLEHAQTVTDADNLAGTTAFAISPDGRFAAATAFQTKSVVLFKRDVDTGELTQADAVRDGMGDFQCRWPIDVAFSTDGKLLFVVDDHGPTDGSQGAVISFRLNDGQLFYSGTDEGRDGCYQGARGIAVHPNGKSVFVVSNDAGTLVAADIDKEAGKTSVRQVIKDEEGDVHGLAGAMALAFGPDGKSLYVSSGRFAGDNAVSAFKLDAEGRISFLQEFLNGQGDLKDFEGGNQIAVSPDGRNVYAVATRSGTVAAFRRDPADGKLTYLETRPDGGEAPNAESVGAAGIAVSPDGRFVYVATEDKKSVSVFQRGEDK